jgi:beta-lactam-binding protein with PASTA domain
MRLVVAALLILAAQVAYPARIIGFAGGAAINVEQSVPMVEVPDCSGLDEADCTMAIEGAGLVAASMGQCSQTVAEGLLIGLSPSTGVSVPIGSEVVILLSSGDCPDGDGVLRLRSRGGMRVR